MMKNKTETPVRGKSQFHSALSNFSPTLYLHKYFKTFYLKGFLQWIPQVSRTNPSCHMQRQLSHFMSGLANKGWDSNTPIPWSTLQPSKVLIL